MKRLFQTVDWLLFFSILPILGAGLITMRSFVGDNAFFSRQIVWITISICIFFIFSQVDFRFLRRTGIVITLFSLIALLLAFLVVAGTAVKGASSWLDVGLFSIQPSDPAKLILIVLLAKYFSRRHVEIARPRHIIISGAYTFVLFVLILLQPDFGSSVMVFLIWLGVVLFSGISRKHLLIIFSLGAIVFLGLWQFGFQEYQRDRIRSFIHPYADLSGSGYNAFQSTIAVGSGGVFGKGVGYGTQSRLKFLPEYETDFIFAAFAEEWGFVGVIILFLLYGIIIWRICLNAIRGNTNFEILYGAGVATYFMGHFFINVGMNIGLLPVTGLVMPFMSYGGSHLVTEFAALGILMGMRKYRRPAHKDSLKNEVLGAWDADPKFVDLE